MSTGTGAPAVGGATLAQPGELMDEATSAVPHALPQVLV
jgi:hypothetical protein